MRRFLIPSLITIFIFSAITYMSCTKESTCTNSCLNGGVCVGRTCVCPTGFTGSDCAIPVTSSITFNNDTYTPVVITANGVIDTIPVAGNKTYFGLYGNALNAVAKTYGVVAGKIIGQVITWDLSKIFPSTGAVSYGLDVDSTLFFLEIQNNSSYATEDMYVNYISTKQTYDTVIIPNDRNTYNIGYYLAFHSTEIYINADPSSGGSFWSVTPFIDTVFKPNQKFVYSLD